MNEKLKELFDKLGTLRLAAWQTKGQGPSSTKIVYMNVGLAAIYGWLLLVCAMAGVYIGYQHVDGTLAALVGSLLLTIVGFATQAQRDKNKATANAQIEQSKGTQDQGDGGKS